MVSPDTRSALEATRKAAYAAPRSELVCGMAVAPLGRARPTSGGAAYGEGALFVARPGLPPHARERGRRQQRERLPVLPEQLELGRAEPVVALALAQVEAVLEQPLVERGDVVEGRNGHEEVPPVAADLVLHIALLVARIGIGEGVVEPVVRREAAEELRDPDRLPDAPADLGGVVEDGPAGHAAYELEDAAQPLADALGRLAPEDLGEPHVGVRERDGQVLAPRGPRRTLKSASPKSTRISPGSQLSCRKPSASLRSRSRAISSRRCFT